MPNPIKPQSAPKAKLPKARVAFQDADSGTFVHPERIDRESICCAVVCFPSAKAARAFVKVANMSQEERVEIVSSALAFGIYEKDGMWERLQEGTRVSWRRTARAVLSALSFPQSGGGK